MAASEATTQTRATGRALPRRITLLALSSVLALSLGSGIFALLQDSVLNPGYSFESGTYQPPSEASFDLQVAVPDPRLDQTCASPSLTWTDGPVTAVLENKTINLHSIGTNWFESFCLRNNTDNPGALYVAMTNLDDSEAGACEPSEAGFDGTCTDGAAGELSDILTLKVWLIHDGQFHGGPELNLNDWPSAPQAYDLQAVGRRVWTVAFMTKIPTQVTPEQRLAAQTDRVTFDLVFTLQDQT
jgi:hypothetical protein